MKNKITTILVAELDGSGQVFGHNREKILKEIKKYMTPFEKEIERDIEIEKKLFQKSIEEFDDLHSKNYFHKKYLEIIKGVDFNYIPSMRSAYEIERDIRFPAIQKYLNKNEYYLELVTAQGWLFKKIHDVSKNKKVLKKKA